MSWSYSRSGRAHALAADMVKTLANQKCSEPEETIKKNIMDTVHDALMSMPEQFIVKLDMAGSQGFIDWNNQTLGSVNQLKVDMQPQHNFVEGKSN